MDSLVGAEDYYKALMKLQPLIAYEAELLHMRQHEWRRSSQRAVTPHVGTPAAPPGLRQGARGGLSVAAR